MLAVAIAVASASANLLGKIHFAAVLFSLFFSSHARLRVMLHCLQRGRRGKRLLGGSLKRAALRSVPQAPVISKARIIFKCLWLDSSPDCKSYCLTNTDCPELDLNRTKPCVWQPKSYLAILKTQLLSSLLVVTSRESVQVLRCHRPRALYARQPDLDIQLFL